RPAEDEGAERPRPGEGREKRHAADEEALGELLAHDAWIHFGTRQEREQDAPERREEIHPWRARQAEHVARDDAERDLDERDRDTDLDRGHGGQQDENAGDDGDEQTFHRILRRPTKNPYRQRR